MRPLMYLLTAMTVMGLAFWAYRENYRTQAAIDAMQKIQNEIAVLRDNLGVLRAEWAYLNRPDRLRELVDMNFDRLRLGPVQSTQFGGPRNVDYPDPSAAAAGEPDDDSQLSAAPSNNRGAPPPRPQNLGAAIRDAAEAATDTAEAPADTAITEADPDASAESPE